MNPSTTIPVGDALLGRVIDATGAPVDGQGPIEAATRLPIDQAVGVDRAPLPDQLLETGIKVLDLYAPIVRGGVMPMIAGSGVGKVVVSNELIQRVATRRGGCAVMAFLDHPTYGLAELVADTRSAAIDRYAALLLGQPDDPSIATVERFVARRRSSDKAALTIVLWQHDPPIMPAGEQVYTRLLRDRDGRIMFNRALGKQNIWPAIDPVQSASRLLDGQALGPEHAQVARAAQALLRDYGDLDGAGATGDDARLQARARRVLLFGSQPFAVAETFTARPGVYVPVTATVRGYSELLAGTYDDVPEEAFRFAGGLEEVIVKAPG